MKYWLGCIGTAIILDGVYSIMLYLGQPSHTGRPQTWRKDHWVRLLRILFGAVIILYGALK